MVVLKLLCDVLSAVVVEIYVVYSLSWMIGKELGELKEVLSDGHEQFSLFPRHTCGC